MLVPRVRTPCRKPLPACVCFCLGRRLVGCQEWGGRGGQLKVPLARISDGDVTQGETARDANPVIYLPIFIPGTEPTAHPCNNHRFLHPEVEKTVGLHPATSSPSPSWSQAPHTCARTHTLETEASEWVETSFFGWLHLQGTQICQGNGQLSVFIFSSFHLYPLNAARQNFEAIKSRLGGC